TISWASDTAGTLSSSGNVIRPAAGQAAKTVVLTATITKSGGTQETQNFTVVVQPLSSDSATAAAEDKAGLTTALLAGGSPDLNTVKGPLVLPTTGPGGSTISWSSADAATITEAGVITRPAAGEAAKTVVLTATITNGTTTTTKTFTVVLQPVPSDPTQAIAEDKATLTDNVLKGASPGLDQAKATLSLPTTGSSGTTISWSSNNAAVSSTGALTRPPVGANAVTVTLTATITKSGGTTETKTFTVVVQPLSSDPTTAIADDKASLTVASVLGGNTAASNVTGDLTLPTIGASGTTISWASSNPTVISASGTVTRPSNGSGDASVTLTATIAISGGTSVTKELVVTVKEALPASQVSTFAGAYLSSGYYDATGTTARFDAPWDIVKDSAGNLFVADTTNNRIRKITTAGVVTTLAGGGNSSSNVDGTGASATFANPRGIAIDSSDNLYVADYTGNRIRKVTPAGVVTTLAGWAPTNSSTPGLFADGTGTNARFSSPSALAFGPDGALYVSDTYNHSIRKVTLAGVVTTFIGDGTLAADADGTGASAHIKAPQGLCFVGTDLFVVQGQNYNVIRKVTSAGVVTHFAGSGTESSLDGTGLAATFYRPAGITADTSGNLYVSEQRYIRKITSAGVVTKLAGVDNSGYHDGLATEATFSNPVGMVISSGAMYVADSGYSTIRKITLP
ncbi:MAG: immunoglobulin-like domain-containing protein, partial [Spirochaetales bacterium]